MIRNLAINGKGRVDGGEGVMRVAYNERNENGQIKGGEYGGLGIARGRGGKP